MQSGISASNDLQHAFKNTLADSNTRGLLATIQNESLVPADAIPRSSLSSTFDDDLSKLDSLLSTTEARYILLREDSSEKCVAITYVPDAANVRQKMLFASTRLTLVRELGTEHFSSTLFATTKEELSTEGWKKQVAHGNLAAPLTEEERNLEGIKEAEAAESMGTGARRGGHVVTGGVSMPVTDEAVGALKGLDASGLVILNLDLKTETISLHSQHSNASPSTMQSTIPSDKPTYSFYRHASTNETLFIYYCPAGCSVKERMVYAASSRSVPVMAEKEAGVKTDKKMEVSEMDELNEKEILREIEPDRPAAGGAGGAGGFARPKRPGRR